MEPRKLALKASASSSSNKLSETRMLRQSFVGRDSRNDDGESVDDADDELVDRFEEENPFPPNTNDLIRSKSRLDVRSAICVGLIRSTIALERAPLDPWTFKKDHIIIVELFTVLPFFDSITTAVRSITSCLLGVCTYPVTMTGDDDDDGKEPLVKKEDALNL